MIAAVDDNLPDIFHDAVLALGTVLAIWKTDDDTVGQVAQGLARAYRGACQARDGDATSAAVPGEPLALHPEIDRLLHRIDEDEDEDEVATQ